MAVIEEVAGLRTALVEPAEAISARPGADVIRVRNPPWEWRAKLAEAGFAIKPDRLTWLAATGSDERAFLAGISAKERQGVAEARRLAAAAGLTLTHAPLDEERLGSFLALYEGAVTAMPNGLPLAVMYRDLIFTDFTRFHIVAMYGAAGMAGGVVLEWCRGVARMRFSAVGAEYRRISLARVLYLEAVRAAREAGHDRVTLGNDPNLYGHLVMPGLFAFKARLGFRPVASTTVDPGDGEDVADRVVSLRALTDPAFSLSYADPEDPGEQALRYDFFTAGATADTRLFTTCFPAPVRVHQVADPHDRGA